MQSSLMPSLPLVFPALLVLIKSFDGKTAFDALRSPVQRWKGIPVRGSSIWYNEVMAKKQQLSF
jgi:hypothetical protein